jgi:hypothetical protein
MDSARSADFVCSLVFGFLFDDMAIRVTGEQHNSRSKPTPPTPHHQLPSNYLITSSTSFTPTSFTLKVPQLARHRLQRICFFS